MAAFWKVVPTIGDTPIFHWEEGGKWFLDRIDGTEERERERDLGVVGNFLFPRCVVPEWREQIRRSLTTSQVFEMIWFVGFGCMFVVGKNGHTKIYLSNDKYTTLEKHWTYFPYYLWNKICYIPEMYGHLNDVNCKFYAPTMQYLGPTSLGG